MAVKFPSGLVVGFAITSAISCSPLGQFPPKAQVPDNSGAITFRTCNPSPTWVRPSLNEQQQQLESLPRYGSQLNSEPLKSEFADFWNHEIFSFTSYGLSARIEPINFSGLGRIAEPLLDCYDSTVAEQVNSGEMGEVWLLSHKVTNLQWSEGEYVMVVESQEEGMEIIYFPRQETETSIPLRVVTEDGEEVEVLKVEF